MDLWQTLSWILFRENCNEWSVFEFISMVSSNLIQLNYEWMLLFVNGDNNFKSGKFFLIWLGRFQVNIWSLTLIGAVLGYESSGFVEIFSTFRFRSDCDVTIGAGWVTSCSKESWWPRVPIPNMTSDQWRHVTKIFTSKVNHPENPGVRLVLYESGNFKREFFESKSILVQLQKFSGNFRKFSRPL